MANRNRQPIGRRMDFGRNDRQKSFNRPGVSPWQQGNPGGIGNILPLASASTEATLALANNLINNLLNTRQNTVPSLLDMPPIRRDFGSDLGMSYDRGYAGNRIGNQGTFRRTGVYNRAGERINARKPPNKSGDIKNKQSSPKKEGADSKPQGESADGDNADAKKTEESGEANTDGDKNVAKTRFDNINSDLLHCHICNKSMWDGRSFENHLNGRAHNIMMQKTAESYALTADTMRQELKIREMKRTRKSGMVGTRDFYCAMCDMYADEGAIHRTTIGHRKLKKFLHPTCNSCRKEMPTRIELDEHRLTPQHLLTLQEKSKQYIAKPKPEVMVISTLSTELSYVREGRKRKRADSLRAARAAGGEAADAAVKEEPEEEMDESAEAKPRLESDAPEDVEGTVLDYKEGEDVTSLTEKDMPKYHPERGVGGSFIGDFVCKQCKLCKKLLDTEETAEVHLRTRKHHQLFVKFMHKTAGLEDPQEGAKRTGGASNEDEGGDFKRRKTNSQDNDVEMEEANVTVKSEPEVETKSETEQQNGTEEANESKDDAEDWEKEVEQILIDEEEPAPAGETVETKEKTPEPEPEDESLKGGAGKPKGTPRGRGRQRRSRI